MSICATLAAIGCSSAPSPSTDIDEGRIRGRDVTGQYVIPEIVLTDVAGQAYRLPQSPSTPVTLVYLAYTRCGGYCNGLLANASTALHGAPPSIQNRVTLIYVSTDPERDSGALLRAYLSRFDPAYIGLRGNRREIERLAERVGVAIVQDPTESKSSRRRWAQSVQIMAFQGDRAKILWTAENTSADIAHDLRILTG